MSSPLVFPQTKLDSQEPPIDADGEARLIRVEIAQYVNKITLKPAGKSYIASGVWDWLGGVAVSMVPGEQIARNSHPIIPAISVIPFEIEIAA